MPRISLKDIDLSQNGYNPVIYQGYVSEAPVYDANILSNTVNRLDTAVEKANEKLGAMDVVAGELRSQLNPNDYGWFNSYFDKKYKDPIESAIAAGNFGTATNLGTTLGGEASRDFKINDRARVNKQYNTWKDYLKEKRDKKLIDETTYLRALSENKYIYNPVYDNNGQNVGGYDWTASFEPVNDISLEDVYKGVASFKGINQESTSYKGGTKQEFYEQNGSRIALRETKTGGLTAESTSEVDAQQWATAFDNYLKANPEIELQLKQKHDNARWLAEQALEKSTDKNLTAEERLQALYDYQKHMNNLTDGHGGYLTTDEYIRKIAQPMFDVMAFRKHTKTTEASDTLVDTKTLERQNLANAMFEGNIVNADLYAQGYSIEFINSNAEQRQTLLRNNQAMRNQLVDDVDE